VLHFAFQGDVVPSAPELIKLITYYPKGLLTRGLGRDVLIAEKFISSGGRLILNLSADWAYKDEYIEADRRLEGLEWVTIEEREC
jgi:hypothetical protein